MKFLTKIVSVFCIALTVGILEHILSLNKFLPQSVEPVGAVVRTSNYSLARDQVRMDRRGE
jgi:hypothetical protein